MFLRSLAFGTTNTLTVIRKVSSQRIFFVTHYDIKFIGNDIPIREIDEEDDMVTLIFYHFGDFNETVTFN